MSPVSKLRAKHWILGLSAPFVIYALLGGVLGHVLAREGSAYRYLTVFQDVVSHIMHNYMKTPDMDKVMTGAIQGMMEGLDEDSVYLSPEHYEAYRKSVEQPGVGVGVELTKRYYLQVLAVLPGSPADQAGLTPGDLIKSINGKNTREFNVVVGAALLRGADGSSLELELVRSRQPDPFKITIPRSSAMSSPVKHKKLDAKTGYVHIASYRKDVDKDVLRAIEMLKGDGASRIVFDARNSYGPNADPALRVAELFISGGTAAKLDRRESDPEELTLAADKVAFDGPVVVLINRGTSGAAEIVASAFAASKRAELVGVVTSGRSAVRETIELVDGSALLLSVAAYTTPDGHLLLGEGLAPTVEATGQAEAEDAILDRGLEVLDEAAEKLKKAA